MRFVGDVVNKVVAQRFLGVTEPRARHSGGDRVGFLDDHLYHSTFGRLLPRQDLTLVARLPNALEPALAVFRCFGSILGETLDS